ncbi:MAG: hypothetical protein JWO63_1162 [Frankiales bacterium]|jgi:hypothetical protein|nr:hypothetical protein [Frankiales bacterium]
MSKRVSVFLVAFGVWSWWIWPTFLANIWKDDRSWDDGPTGFFLVHLVLVVVSLVLGTIMGVLGVRGLLALRRARLVTANGEGSDRDLAGTNANPG